MARTPASIEKELRKIAKSVQVEFRVADLTGNDASAMLVWGQNGLPDLVMLDPYLGGLIEGAVHELLHINQRHEMKSLGRELEEAHIEGFEDRIVRYVNQSKSRVRWWRRTIEKRLP